MTKDEIEIEKAKLKKERYGHAWEREEAGLCTCGAAGTWEGHSDDCDAKAFNKRGYRGSRRSQLIDREIDKPR